MYMCVCVGGDEVVVAVAMVVAACFVFVFVLLLRAWQRQLRRGARGLVRGCCYTVGAPSFLPFPMMSSPRELQIFLEINCPP